MKRNKFVSKLAYNWWMYLLSSILIIAFWLFLFNSLSQPKQNQKLLISIAAGSVQTVKMENDLKGKLPDLSDQEIKQVTVETIPYESAYNLTNVLFSRCLDSDIIIVSHSAMFEGIGEGYIPALDEEKITEHFGDVEFFREKNGSAYAILLYDGQTENNFSKYYSGTDKCWLFITGESVNTAELNGKGNKDDDAAYQTIKWLLSKSQGE